MKNFFFILSLLSCFSLKASNDIPNRGEIADVKYLFEDLVTRHDFAYTIFGSKPMSLADMCLQISPNLPIHKHLKARFIFAKLKRSLNTWYKYRDGFHFKDFIFLDQEEDLFDCLVFILINKNNMINVLNDHIAIFKEKLGDSFTPESFLAKLEKRELSLAQAIQDSDRLLGIMLGYGERNATLFQERFDLLRAVSKRKKENLPLDCILLGRLEAIEAKLGDFSEPEEEPILPPLYFLADTSHPETIALKQQYTRDRQKIERLMRKPKFMDRVLNRLVE
jgi:hypothetical protein